MSATTLEKPRTSGSLPAQEGTTYASLSDGDKRLVSLGVDSYLAKQDVAAEEYSARVETLRAQFSEPGTLLTLRSRSFANQPAYGGR